VRILVVNSGSSSLKLTVLSPEGAVDSAVTVERWGGHGHLEPLQRFLADAGRVDAVGHRVVHGGPRFHAPALVDQALVGYLDSIRDLAPLHNPRAVAGIRALRDLLPATPSVACFDTAFHATLPAAAHIYALPREWNRRWGLRRYGFHGLSHAHATRRGAELAGTTPAEARIVSCHLGAGASLAAVRHGVSVDTTMDFTPLAGLVMATRSGDVDPGLMLWLLRHGDVPVDELNEALESRSGLKGLSGTSGDLRDVLAGRDAGDADCALAVDVFLHQLCREIAAMTAAAGGLDLLVMTGGIGEHAPLVRAEVAERLAYLGTAIDPAANDRARGDADTSGAGAVARTVVVTAREDLEIAREVQALLSSPRPEREARRSDGSRPSSAGPDAVVFDLDGVLVDSETQWDEVRRELAAKAGRPWPADATKAMLGMSTAEWSAYMTDVVGVPGPREKVASAVIGAMVDRYRSRLPLTAGAVDAVRRLGAVWPLGLATSSPRVLIDAVFTTAGLADAFDAAVSTEEVAAGKPSPDVYQEVARRMGVDPGRAVAVEDSANGLRSATWAGLRVIALPNEAFPPGREALALAGAVVHSLDEISPELVASVGSRAPDRAGARPERHEP
jgi:acetate kinase